MSLPAYTPPITRRTSTNIALWLAFAVIEFAALMVFWCFDALPFMDLPGHAGVIALRAFYPHSDFLRQYFVVAPHFGAYSLFRFIGDGLAQWTGSLSAVRTLACLPVLGIPTAILYARRRLYGEIHPFFAYTALILSFGFMTIMGFASYMLAIAVFIVTLTEWLCLIARQETAALAEIKVGLLSVILFVSHGFAFVAFIAVATVTSISSGPGVSRIARLRSLGPAVVAMCYSFWIEHVDRQPDILTAPLTVHFQGIIDKISLLATPTLTTRTGIDLMIGIMIWISTAFAVLKSWHTPSLRTTADDVRFYSRTLSIVSLTTLTIFAVLPHSIGWFGFVDGRLLPLTLLTGLLAIRPDIFSKRTQWTATVAAGLGTVTTVALLFFASYKFQDEAYGYAETLASVPQGARLLYFPLEPNSRLFVGHPFVHYDKLALAQRPILPSDIWFQEGTAIYPTPINPILQLPKEYSSSDLKSINWPSYRLDDWDYVLIRRYREASPPDAPPALSLVSHHGGWWLYRNAPHPSDQLPDRSLGNAH